MTGKCNRILRCTRQGRSTRSRSRTPLWPERETSSRPPPPGASSDTTQRKSSPPESILEPSRLKASARTFPRWQHSGAPTSRPPETFQRATEWPLALFATKSEQSGANAKAEPAPTGSA